MLLLEGVDAAFRKKYGIAPKGAGPHPPSSYGLPLPPKGHPAAVPFARAVLRRAGQAENFPADAVAKQVAKAKAILAAQTKETEETATLIAALTNAPPPKPAISEAAAAMPIVHTETTFALREDVPTLSHAAADPSVIPGVLIIRSGPGNLGDRNFYSPQALTSAVSSKIFEGARCYLDHPTPYEEDQQPGRSVEDLAGWYDNITTAPYTDPETGATCTGLFGDFHPQVGRDDVASLIRTCAEYAKKFPTKAYVGLSISARGAGEPDLINGEPWNRIDEITFVESVDIVTRAGAGGGFLPLRESFKMAKRTTKNGDGIAVTIDRTKLEEGAKALRAEVKTGVLDLLEKAKVKLTPEQDQALDKHLGIIDGGKIDNVLDAATGVDPDVDTESKESKKREDDMMEDDDMTEGKSPAPDDEDPFREGMSDAEKLKMWPKMKELFGKKQAEAKAKEAAAAKALGEAKKLTESALATTRAVDVDSVIAELNPPDSFRPRLRRELIESSAKTRPELKERAQEFASAYITPLLERGGLGGHAPSGGSSGMKFDTSLYAEA